MIKILRCIMRLYRKVNTTQTHDNSSSSYYIIGFNLTPLAMLSTRLYFYGELLDHGLIVQNGVHLRLNTISDGVKRFGYHNHNPSFNRFDWYQKMREFVCVARNRSHELV